MAQMDNTEAAATAASRQKSLELLYDYTKFHIGLYLTLSASYIAAAAIKRKEDDFALDLNHFLVWPAVACFMIAGLAGGVIASSVTQSLARSSQDFLNERIGPWNFRLLHFRALIWTWIEHTAFWLGLIAAALSAIPSWS